MDTATQKAQYVKNSSAMRERRLRCCADIILDL